MSRYSYTLLTAESEPDALDDRGMASEEAVLQAFDAFDWPTQVKTADRIQKCSPTFSVHDHATERRLWVSGISNTAWSLPFFKKPPDLLFVHEYRHAEQVVARPRELELSEARQAIALFVADDHAGLLALLSG